MLEVPRTETTCVRDSSLVARKKGDLGTRNRMIIGKFIVLRFEQSSNRSLGFVGRIGKYCPVANLAKIDRGLVTGGQGRTQAIKNYRQKNLNASWHLAFPY